VTWAPGQSGNPSGWQGGRQRRHREIFDEIKKLGHRDALLTLSTIQHDDKNEPELRIAAAAALAPFAHPKLQAIPTPRFIDNPIDVPHFDRISDAENFLARLPVLVARGELDFQSAQDLCAMTTLWINSQYQREELAIKQITAGTSEHEQTIRITGGLGNLPGTETILPQVIDGRIVQPILINGQLVHPETKQPVTNGHALAAPADAVPQIESFANASVLPAANDSAPGANAPPNLSTNGQGTT
jgi:hypothetical protein